MKWERKAKTQEDSCPTPSKCSCSMNDVTAGDTEVIEELGRLVLCSTSGVETREEVVSRSDTAFTSSM